VASSHLIVGGARSGKSRFAVQGQSPRARVVFVATAEARDADMAARIARHRAERPAAWTTVEEPCRLVACLEGLGTRPAAVIVDCLTLWVANLVLRGQDEGAIAGEGQRLAALVARRPWDLTVITNEVGEGVHPETETGRRFRDALGLVNQAVAAAAERVTLMVAGLPLTIKGTPP